MAGEFVVLNPRRRRRRKATRARARTRTPRRRRRVRVHHNPIRRRRRRVGARRHVRRHRVHRNPRMNLAGIDFGSTLITAGGFIGSDVAAGYVTQMLPAGWQTPVARLGVKVAIGVGAPMLLRKFLGARTANLIAAGAVLSAAVDAYHLWVAPMIGLHGYEVGMTNYAPLSGVHEDAQLGGGENIYGDTIY